MGQAYGLGAFYEPLKGSGDAWIANHLSGVFTLAMLTLGISAAFAGWFAERVGPKAIAFCAALLFCLGLAGAGIAIKFHQIYLFYLAYGVVAGMGMGLGYVAPLQMLLDWFPERRSLATGLAITGFGGGAMIATALSSLLLDLLGSPGASGAGETMILLAAIYAIIMLIALPNFCRPPREAAAFPPSLDAYYAFRTPQFYILWILLFASVSSGINLLAGAPGSLAKVMGRPASIAEISSFVALLSLSNMIGRFLVSLAADRLGPKAAMMLLLLAGAFLHLCTPAIAWRLNLPFTILQFMLMISVYGGIFAVMPSYVADVFGPKAAGRIHGGLLTAWSAGAVVSFLATRLMGRNVENIEFFYATALILIIAFTANFFVQPAIAGPEHRTIAEGSNDGGQFSTQRSFGFWRAWLAIAIPLFAGVTWTIQKAAAIPLSGQIGLTLLPLVMGAAVCVFFTKIDDSRFAVRGVSNSYYSALAVLFGLYASLMANEVWQRNTNINDLLDKEVSALQALVTIGKSIAPEDARITQSARSFANGLVANDRTQTSSASLPPDLERAMQALYEIGGDGRIFSGHAPQNASYLAALETLRFSHLQRTKLRNESRDSAKIVGLLIFGLLTQIAIALSHAGNRRAILTTVMLFSVSFSVAVALMELLDGAIRHADATGFMPLL